MTCLRSGPDAMVVATALLASTKAHCTQGTQVVEDLPERYVSPSAPKFRELSQTCRRSGWPPLAGRRLPIAAQRAGLEKAILSKLVCSALLDFSRASARCRIAVRFPSGSWKHTGARLFQDPCPPRGAAAAWRLSVPDVRNPYRCLRSRCGTLGLPSF
jgi:hypothetical protein